MQDKDWMNLHQIYPAGDHPTTGLPAQPRVDNPPGNDSVRLGQQSIVIVNGGNSCAVCGTYVPQGRRVCIDCLMKNKSEGLPEETQEAENE